MTLKERLFSKTTICEDGCWICVCSNSDRGYARIRYKGSSKMLAHRVSWEVHKGLIPEGIQVLHTCDIPACVNPEHLFLGTSQDNMDDKVNKGRHKYPIGIDHPMTKLTEEQVLEIRRIHAANTCSQIDLAHQFNVTPANIRHIIKRTLWSHI